MVDLSKLQPGQVETVGGLVYGRCGACLNVVRMNRFLFGSRHYCVPLEPNPEVAWLAAQQAKAERVRKGPLGFTFGLR